jgi:hypothetical protein
LLEVPCGGLPSIVLCSQIVSGVAFVERRPCCGKDGEKSEVTKENAPLHGVTPEADSTPANTTLEVLKNALGVHMDFK